MRIKSMLYKGLKLSNDIAAVKNGRVGKRVKQRLLSKLFWRLFR